MARILYNPVNLSVPIFYGKSVYRLTVQPGLKRVEAEILTWNM